MKEMITVTSKQVNDIAALLKETEDKASEILGVRVSVQMGSHAISSMEISETLKMTMRFVAAAYDTEVDYIIGKTRLRNVVEARQMFWLISYDMLNVTFKDLATMTGERNHTTVIYGVKTMRNEVQLYDRPRKMYELLKDKINSI